MPRKIPPPMSLALTLLRLVHGWSGKDLAAAAGISPSTLSQYETGDLILTRERLTELAAVMKAAPEKVELALFCADLIHPLPPPAFSPVDPTPEQRRVVDQATALAVREVAELVRSALLGEVRQDNVRRAFAAAEALLSRLKARSGNARRDLIEEDAELQDWALCLNAGSRGCSGFCGSIGPLTSAAWAGPRKRRRSSRARAIWPSGCATTWT